MHGAGAEAKPAAVGLALPKPSKTISQVYYVFETVCPPVLRFVSPKSAAETGGKGICSVSQSVSSNNNGNRFYVYMNDRFDYVTDSRYRSSTVLI